MQVRKLPDIIIDNHKAGSLGKYDTTTNHEWSTLVLSLILILSLFLIGIDSQVAYALDNENADTTTDISDIDFEDTIFERYDVFNYRFRGWINNDLHYNWRNDESPLNPQNIFSGEEWGDDIELNVVLDANLYDLLGFFYRGRLKHAYSQFDDDYKNKDKVHTDQAYTTIELGQGILFFFSVGKQKIKWGTGYYWNPVDTFNIRQDLREPETKEEGKNAYRIDIAFPWFSAAGIVVPNVENKIVATRNYSFDEEKGMVLGKLSTFIWDTDLTLYASTRKGENAQWGASISTVKSDTQIFGELLYWEGQTHNNYLQRIFQRSIEYDPIGDTYYTLPSKYTLFQKEGCFHKFVLGGQHTFFGELTLIAEYYYNGEGFNGKDMEEYIEYLEYYHQEYPEDITSLKSAFARNPGFPNNDYPSREFFLAIGNELYEFTELRKNYFHISINRLSYKNRFDLGLDLVLGIDDIIENRGLSSFLRPWAAYTAVPNWRFSLFAQAFGGGTESEFGILYNDYSLSLVVKYSFQIN